MVSEIEWQCLDCGIVGTASDLTEDVWDAIGKAVRQHNELSPQCPWEWARIFPKGRDNGS